MAGREELYLKHIDESLAKIAKSLDRIAECKDSLLMEETEGSKYIYMRAVKDMVEFVESKDTAAKSAFVRFMNQLERESESGDVDRSILYDFAAYYSGYAVTDEQHAQADDIYNAIDKYMDLKEATK